MLKIGDIVTQSKEFYNYWNSDKVLRTINMINGNIVILDKPIRLYYKENSMKDSFQTNRFPKSYLKIDLVENRKLKLKKIEK